MTKIADRRDTLLLPFERGLLDAPVSERAFLFLNAEPLPDGGLREALVCEQGFRPAFQDLEKGGYTAQPHLEVKAATQHAGALILLGRSRRKNEADISRTWDAVTASAPIVVAGAKTDGIASIRKWAGAHTAVADSLSKHHAMAFWFNKAGSENPFPANPEEEGNSAPGMFSADGPDPASAMLSRHFSEHIAGRVADFGAGWGYLGMEMLKRCPDMTALESFEADWLSLEACKRNLDGSNHDAELAFKWIDLTREKVERRFDWVVMNPPFHAGRAAQPSIGQAFIRAASNALKPGGRLLMVANRNLPYERSLESAFAKVVKLEEADGFKVFEARR